MFGNMISWKVLQFFEIVKDLRYMFRGGSYKDNFDESLRHLAAGYSKKIVFFSDRRFPLYTVQYRGLAFGFLSHRRGERGVWA